MTPLVLIPGMMCDARLYAPQMPVVGRRTVAVAACTEAETMGELAARILSDAPPRFALGGLSMGGIVAMEIVRQAPERVERLALLDTNPLPETSEVSARREPQISRALAGCLADVMREEMKPNYLASRDPELLDLCLDMALSLGAEVFVRQSRALASRPDQRDTLAAFGGPALILMGARDIVCPRERHELMHALLPQSRMVVVEGAGHLPTLERPDETNAALQRWLEE
jgi:pimeloyl-ACP methyl ester carboxylesterase